MTSGPAARWFRFGFGDLGPVRTGPVYAELTGADASAAERYPGIAAHLQACGPCGEDFDGLLAAMRSAAD